MARRYPLLTFFMLAYGLAWPFAFAIALFGAPLDTSFAAALGPLLAAIITHRWWEKTDTRFGGMSAGVAPSWHPPYVLD
jgi:hypothetical protein